MCKNSCTYIRLYAGGAAPSGYVDGYNDGVQGSSGHVPHPSSNSPWSTKSFPVGKGQVIHTCIYTYIYIYIYIYIYM